jgi:hypothetical protein
MQQKTKIVGLKTNPQHSAFLCGSAFRLTLFCGNKSAQNKTTMKLIHHGGTKVTEKTTQKPSVLSVSSAMKKIFFNF